MKEKKRCSWVNPKNPLYIKYHDTEWGRPVKSDRKLFEMLILEGAQAGLSWETVLKKRKGYREAFKNFDIAMVARLSDSYLNKQLENENIIRNKLKVYSVRQNAKVFIKVQKEFKSFSKYLWAYVDNEPINSQWKTIKQVPSKTELSDEIAKDLKKRGMNFVGSTIIYAYLQAAGLVNDHTVDCEFASLPVNKTMKL